MREFYILYSDAIISWAVLKYCSHQKQRNMHHMLFGGRFSLRPPGTYLGELERSQTS